MTSECCWLRCFSLLIQFTKVPLSVGPRARYGDNVMQNFHLVTSIGRFL